MKLGTYFKSCRVAKGLTEPELALLIREDFQPSMLWDFEGGDENDIDGWSIWDFKRYGEVLEVRPTDFSDIDSLVLYAGIHQKVVACGMSCCRTKR